MVEAVTVAPEAQTPRRQFELPAEDLSFLNALELRWETLTEAGQRWLLIYEEQCPMLQRQER